MTSVAKKWNPATHSLEEWPWDMELGKPTPMESVLKLPRTAPNICRRAAMLVNGDRAKTHGPLVENHQNIADHWNAYLGPRLKDKLSPKDVALMMVELKVARTKLGAYNPDDYDDLCGYGAVAGEIADSGQ